MAIMRILRSQLLPLDFNACIMLFANFPELNVQHCVDEAQSLYNNTPFSVGKRVNRSPVVAGCSFLILLPLPLFYFFFFFLL
jgi:hypothetical protein